MFILAEPGEKTIAEIAEQIAKTCRTLNIQTVAVLTMPWVSSHGVHQPDAEFCLKRIAAVSDTVIPIFPGDYLKSISKVSESDGVYQSHYEMMRLAVKGVKKFIMTISTGADTLPLSL